MWPSNNLWQSRNVAWHIRDPVCGWRADPVQMSIQTPPVVISLVRIRSNLLFIAVFFNCFFTLTLSVWHFFNRKMRENYMRDYVKSVPVCCPPCVAKRLRQRNYVQFKSSTSSVPRNFGKYRSCIGILICASHRHLPPFCAITVITFRSVSFQFSSINWLFLVLWSLVFGSFVHFRFFNSTQGAFRLRLQCPQQCPSFQEKGNCEGQCRRHSKEKLGRKRELWRIEQRGSPV